MTHIEALKLAMEAITQILDDGDHIASYTDDDAPIFNRNEKHGSYCYAAGEQAMEALQAIDTALKSGEHPTSEPVKVDARTLGNALNSMKAVLCDPEGVVCIYGSDGDRAVIQESLQTIENILNGGNYGK